MGIPILNNTYVTNCQISVCVCVVVVGGGGGGGGGGGSSFGHCAI